jgi:hypothetical protein
MVITLPYIIFRVSTVLFENVRYALIMSSVGTTGDKVIN